MSRFYKVFLVLFSSFLLCAEVIIPIEPRKNAVWHNETGLDYMKTGYFYGAIQEFKLAILLNEDSPSTGVFYNNLGEAYMKIGQYAWASDCFEHAIKYNPNFIYYYENYANALKKSGRLNSEILRLRQSTSQNPKRSSGWLMLGIFYKTKNQNKNAIECFDKFLALEPKIILAPAVKEMRDNLKKIH